MYYNFEIHKNLIAHLQCVIDGHAGDYRVALGAHFLDVVNKARQVAV